MKKTDKLSNISKPQELTLSELGEIAAQQGNNIAATVGNVIARWDTALTLERLGRTNEILASIDTSTIDDERASALSDTLAATKRLLTEAEARRKSLLASTKAYTDGINGTYNPMIKAVKIADAGVRDAIASFLRVKQEQEETQRQVMEQQVKAVAAELGVDESTVTVAAVEKPSAIVGEDSKTAVRTILYAEIPEEDYAAFLISIMGMPEVRALAQQIADRMARQGEPNPFIVVKERTSLSVRG